ncbi:MAG TPA: class I SAM-dependent methyltransferase [Terriglobales bacterium]|nr:class I SAM-dependent methyltransferase [Terriglobales bacterium]
MSRSSRRVAPAARGARARRSSTRAAALRRAKPRRSSVPPKQYDRAYFERWYRDPRYTVVHQGVLARRVQLAVAAAEYLLERPLRTVLDVGCGEAPWRALLLRARPNVRYTGVDSSAYVVRRYGRKRGIRLGRLGALARLDLDPPYDLIVCSDVLHYVATDEARRGLRAIARLLGGVAFIETFAREDPTEGDQDEFQQRPASTYRRLFREAGLIPLGLHCYAGRALKRDLTTFERGDGGRPK